MKELGGFDEEMDGVWGNDNTNLGYRASLEGIEFYNLVNNPAVSLRHDPLFGHPFRHTHDPVLADQRLLSFKDGYKLKL